MTPLQQGGHETMACLSGKDHGKKRMVSLHWRSQSIKSGFARTKVPCLKNLDILAPRIDAKKLTDDTLKDTKEIERPDSYRGLQIDLVIRSI